jgi:fructokinase
MTGTPRIGIDLGGTKIAALCLGREDEVLASERISTPRGDYDATIEAIAQLAERLEETAGTRGSIGIGMPGSISPATGLIQNANSVWLNGRALNRDLGGRLGRPVRLANDANCFALSEAADGAGRDAATVFGVILGTGCGGAIVIDGKCLIGRHAIGGEWGHNPLPWTSTAEHPGAQCWCGRRGCIETWVSGPGMARDHTEVTARQTSAQDIVAAAGDGDEAARATLARHANRLARSLAMVVNMIDPDVIVLGGGLSNAQHLYEQVPGEMERFIFADHCSIRLLPPVHGDASGVRGAARLWDED